MQQHLLFQDHFTDAFFPVSWLEVFSNKQLLVFFSQCEHHVVSVSVLKTTGRLKESRVTAQRPPCKSSFYVTNLYKLTLRLKKKYLKTIDTKGAVPNDKGFLLRLSVVCGL